jgi:hypothetical protein
MLYRGASSKAKCGQTQAKGTLSQFAYLNLIKAPKKWTFDDQVMQCPYFPEKSWF